MKSAKVTARLKKTDMKSILTFLLLLAQLSVFSQNTDEQKINSLLNNWHKDAATANGDGYFALMTDDAIYIGTDATEHWTKEQFQSFAKPYFDAGKAWSFVATDRNIYFSSDKKVAWFDELLDTWMGVCRGSGVLEKTEGKWLLKHYHLAVTVPNDDINEVIKVISKK
jgi:ketosteroid isomerase-like protein